jgi:hypothetical protein
MKKVFLLMVVSGLLVTRGFAQIPDAGSNADQANVKGCLGGSDGNYTVAEDGTRQIFKITTSRADLKPHLGHDVELIGHKGSGAVSPGVADNNFTVTELSMISDHCAAVAPAAAANPSSQTVSSATADAAPAAPVSPSSETVSTPSTADTTPAATGSSPSSATVSTPAADAAPPTRPSAARPSRVSAPKTATAAAATASPSSATVSTPAATASTPSEAVTPPAAAATAPTVTHSRGSLFLLILVAVLVIVLGTLAPLLGRWRKRKMLERTGTPNLSFTKEESSDRNKPGPRKAA